MIVYAIYIMSNDGRIIVSEHFQSIESISDDVLLSGLLTALQGIAVEMTNSNSDLKTIEIEGLSYHIKSFWFYKVILVTDIAKAPEDIIQMLGLRFMKQFGEIWVESDGLVDLNAFNPFKKNIREIILQETVLDDSKSIKPIKKLNTGEIYSLPYDLQSTALAMVSLEEATIEEIANEIDFSLENTLKNVIILQEMGYIGEKGINGKTVYFRST
ncbi:MAG: hypothetical protein ACXAEU_08800 [Candidatus Hodarchaeales archaeon]|jgi:hypothetical protein